MLERMRSFTQSWFAKLLLGLLVPAFGIWGIGSIFQGRVDSSVAHVGKAGISVEEFTEAYRRQTDAFRSQAGPDFDPERLKALGLPEAVLNNLIQDEVFEQNARDLKIAVPDDVLVTKIHEIESFQGADGKFDSNRYAQVLRENNFTELRFESSMRRELKRFQIFSAVLGGVPLPKAVIEPLFLHRSETRVAQYVILPQETAGAVAEPTESDIAAYYAANKSEFMAPEYRDITVVNIAPKDVADSIAVSDEEARTYYDSHAAEFVTPEKRQIEQIKFASEAEATAASDQIRAGKRFESVAQERGFSPEDRVLGLKAKSDLDPPLGDAAFSVTEGAVTLPVKGKFGWVILRTTAVTPQKVESFEEAKLAIRSKIAEDRANDKINAVSTELEDQRAKGGSLEDAVGAVNAKTGANLKVEKYAVDAEGKGPDGKPIDALVETPEIVTMAMRSEVNEDTDITSTREGGYFVVRVDRVSPAAERPIAAVTPAIRETLKRERRVKALDARAQKIAEQIKGGKSFDTIATELGRPVQTSAPLPRGGASETFSRDIIEKLFNAKPGDVVAGPVTVGDSYLLMKLTQVNTPKASEAADAFRAVQRDLQQTFTNELMTQYAEGLKERYKVRVNQKAVDSAIGGS